MKPKMKHLERPKTAQGNEKTGKIKNLKEN